MKKLMCCLIVLCVALTPLTVLAANDKKTKDQQGTQAGAKDKAAKDKGAKDKAAKDTLEKTEKAMRAAFDKENNKLTNDQRDKLYKAKKDLDKKLVDLSKSEAVLKDNEIALNKQKDSFLQDNNKLEINVDKVVETDASIKVDGEIADPNSPDPSLEAKANKELRKKNYQAYKENLQSLLDKIKTQEKLIKEKYKAGKYDEVLTLQRQIIDMRAEIIKLNKTFIEQEKQMKADMETFKKDVEKKTKEKKEKKEKSVIDDVYAQ